MRPDALRPMHRSVMQKQASARGFGIRPVNMARLIVTDEQREGLQEIALGIFTDMTNAGASLQETLAAVYLSGLQHATEASFPTPSKGA